MGHDTDNTIRIQYQSRLYELPYTLIRSNRRSCSISIDPDARITVRVPLHASEKDIRSLLIEKRLWIVTRYLEAMRQKENRPASTLTDTQRTALEKRYIAAAKDYFPKRAAYFVQFTGGTYNRITIRDQKTR